jgi:hypothetical protein
VSLPTACQAELTRVAVAELALLQISQAGNCQSARAENKFAPDTRSAGETYEKLMMI